jgi:hypothetical protein
MQKLTSPMCCRVEQRHTVDRVMAKAMVTWEQLRQILMQPRRLMEHHQLLRSVRQDIFPAHPSLAAKDIFVDRSAMGNGFGPSTSPNWQYPDRKSLRRADLPTRVLPGSDLRAHFTHTGRCSMSSCTHGRNVDRPT